VLFQDCFGDHELKQTVKNYGSLPGGFEWYLWFFRAALLKSYPSEHSFRNTYRNSLYHNKYLELI
jgi:hypothetical protein